MRSALGIHAQRQTRRVLGAAAAALAILVTISFFCFRTSTAPRALTARHLAAPNHPPWVLGRADARFTIIEYADLECPYCRAYFPVLRHWIEEHPEVNWEWRNLPLPMHEPAASREALLAECAGEAAGNGAFWQAVAWIYGHTRGNGAGLPAGTQLPGMSRAIRACLKSASSTHVIRLQAAQAAREHLVATPTLRLVDRKTDRSLELEGSIEGDALLSALDFLALRPGPRATREDSSH